MKIVELAVGDMNKAGDVAAPEVKQRMHFDGGLGGQEMRPWKERHAEVYGC